MSTTWRAYDACEPGVSDGEARGRIRGRIQTTAENDVADRRLDWSTLHVDITRRPDGTAYVTATVQEGRP